VRTEVPSDLLLHEMITDALPADSDLTPMKGFKLDLSANRGFRKVFFSARCGCGTAALLSVEVAEDKTTEQIEQALPALAGKLQAQATTFHTMSCETHARMRLGPAAPL